ncbi:MAG: lipocalin family protein [Flavobacteriia bacterium]|nr:lipocalin family protein [Flavobacteriia bacterium]
MNSKLLIFSLVLLILTACSSNHLIGKWKLDNIDIEKAIADFPENQKDNMRMMLKTSLNNMKNKFFIEFNDNGKYSIEAADENGVLQKKSGTWELSSDKKKLKTVTEGKEETVEVVEITANKLTLNMSSPSQSSFEMSFVPR